MPPAFGIYFMEEMIFIRLLPQPNTRGIAFPFFEIAVYYIQTIYPTSQKINAMTDHAKDPKQRKSCKSQRRIAFSPQTIQ